MSQFDARKVSVHLKIGEATIPINSIELYHVIDELPFVTFSAQLNNQTSTDINNSLGSVKINLKRISPLSRMLQEKFYNDFRLTPDLKILVRDGDGNELTFNGILGRPKLSLNAGQLGLGFSGIHKMAVLQSFDAQIYTQLDQYTLPFLSDIFHDESGKSKKTDSIADRILTIIKSLMEHSVFQKEAGLSDFHTLPIHRLNEKAFKHVEKVLTDSSKTTSIGGISDPSFVDESLHHSIYKVLINSQSFFQAFLAHFNPMFMFQMNATWDGQLWMEHIPCVEPAEGRMIKVPPQNFLTETASSNEPPILQTIVRGPGSSFYALSGSNGARPEELNPAVIQEIDKADFIQEMLATGVSSVRSLATFPKTRAKNAEGKFQVLDSPAWLNAPEFVKADIVNVENQSMSALLDDFDKLESVLAVQDQARRKILEHIAATKFKEQYLKRTYASVTAPLNVKAQVGRTYEVYATTGEHLFTGFLHSITHSIKVAGDNAEAVTSMNFAYVLAAGAKINALPR